MSRTACTEPQCLYKGALYEGTRIIFMFLSLYLQYIYVIACIFVITLYVYDR